MVLVDTSVWIDFFNGQATAHTEKLDSLLSSTIVVVGDLIPYRYPYLQSPPGGLTGEAGFDSMQGFTGQEQIP